MDRRTARSGQIVLILAFILAGLLMMFLMVSDIFLTVRNKNRIQNAGDAAALMAARWQGVTLNLIGELNLLHLAAACETNETAMAGIVALQERLAIVGPLVGFWAANETAKRNGAPPDDGMTEIVRYAARAAETYVSPAWPEKGADYAAMLHLIAADGVAAGADNARLLPAVTVGGGHPLYSRTFYRAADSRNWPAICRHVFGCNHAKATSTLLAWPGWGDIPPASISNDMVNSEFFGVGVQRVHAPFAFGGGNVKGELVAAAAELGLDGVVTSQAIDEFHVLEDMSYPWYLYDFNWWRDWRELDRGGETRFPLMGSVKQSYNVMGAAAACRVRDELPTLSETAVTNVFTWTAAAKPFGDEDGRRVIDVLPGAPLVLPSFRFTRLIPIGGVGEGNLGAADEEWLAHVRVHVPNKIRVPGCSYCRILDKWDEPGYTRAGGEYLMNHAHDEVCEPPTSGHGEGGGTHYAH